MIEGEHLVSVLATNVKHLARERERGETERERECVGGGGGVLWPCSLFVYATNTEKKFMRWFLSPLRLKI